MSNPQERIKKQAVRTEHDIHDLSTRLQHQVNELVERVTGVKEARKQALSLGLAMGVVAGIVMGVVIGIMIGELANDENGA